jgi:MFS transporter, DHA1 family, tetracycline resistance protein
VNVLIGFLILPESLPKERREATPIRPGDFNPITTISEMARKPGLGWLLGVWCLFNFALNGIGSISSLFYIDKFDVQPWQVGSILVFGGAALAVVQFLLVQRLVSWFGDRVIAISSLVGQAICSLGIFLSPAFWLVYPINMINSAMSGFTFPTLTTLNTDRVTTREMGLLMGVTTALGSLMNIAGPLWAGLVYDRVMPGAPLWMGAFVYALAALMLTWPALKRPAMLRQG